MSPGQVSCQPCESLVHSESLKGADVGRPSIGDVDGDGLNEIYVPAYDAGQVVQYKVKMGEDHTTVVV